MAKFDLRSWAVKGAERRLAEIAAEARAIFSALPELRGSVPGFEAAAIGADDYGGTATGPSKRKRRKRSAEARRRMSEAQAARWAKQRKGRKAINLNLKPKPK